MSNSHAVDVVMKLGVKWLEKILAEKLFQDSHEPNEFVPFLEAFYALNEYSNYFRIPHSLISEFKKVMNEGAFWNSTTFWDNPYLLYYTAKLGFISNPKFLTLVAGLIKQNQNLEGYIKINEYDHTGAMHILILVEPKSQVTEKAIEFFLLNKDIFFERAENSAGFYYDSIPIGVLALNELDSTKYASIIDILSQKIKGYFSVEGFIKFDDLPHRSYKNDVIKNTTLSIIALAKGSGKYNEYVNRATKWIKSQQLSNGSWNDSILDTSKAISALISS